MAILVTTGTSAPGLTVNGTDLSDHVKAIEVQENYADMDVTGMGATSQQHAPGLRDDRIIVTFMQDYAASKVDATLTTLLGATSAATVIAYSNGTTATSTAPKWTMGAVLLDYSPINVGAPGDVSQTQVTFVPAQGTSTSLVRGTS
jgi:hypothetical protein